MAVKTLLDADDLSRVARTWSLGSIHAATGIPQGSINTLYTLDTTSGRFVLRLSEGRAEHEVAFETALLAHLEAERFPAARLRPTIEGSRFSSVQGRFACVFGFAAGESLRAGATTATHAHESGRVLGRLHAVTNGFPATLENRNGPKAMPGWLLRIEAGLRARASVDDSEVLEFIEELRLGVGSAQTLPPAAEGLVHADWFPDNLLWIGDRISAVLDFEMACRAPLVLDLAIAIHAGCYGQRSHDLPRVRAFVEGYLSERTPSRAELEAFPAWARFAALRFTASRILDFHFSPLDASRLVKKDWRRFRDRYRHVTAMDDDALRTAWGLGAR